MKAIDTIMLDSDEPDRSTIVVDTLPNRCVQLKREVECGGRVEATGFGLAGGGFGWHAVCCRCRRMYKVLVDDSDDLSEPEQPSSDCC